MDDLDVLVNDDDDDEILQLEPELEPVDLESPSTTATPAEQTTEPTQVWRPQTVDLPPPEVVESSSHPIPGGVAYNQRCALMLGVGFIVSGVTSFGIAIGSAIVQASYWYIAHGFWTSIVCAIAGGINIRASSVKTRFMVTLQFALSVAVAVCSVVMTALAVYGATMDSLKFMSSKTAVTAFTLSTLLSLLGILEFSLAVASLIIAYRLFKSFSRSRTTDAHDLFGIPGPHDLPGTFRNDAFVPSPPSYDTPGEQPPPYNYHKDS